PCDVDVEVEVASHRERKTAWSVAAFPTICEGGARRQAECQGCQPKASVVEHGETSKKRKERAAVIQGCRQLNMPHERRTGQLKRPAALMRGPGEVVVIVRKVKSGSSRPTIASDAGCKSRFSGRKSPPQVDSNWGNSTPVGSRAANGRSPERNSVGLEAGSN